MRVLVTGGSGYVGSHAVRGLVAAGHQVVIYDNLSTGFRSLSDGFELVEGDISDVARVSRCLEDVDAVMHFAASAYVGESVRQPRKYFHNNVESALKLLDGVLSSRVRLFVFSSTCATFGIPRYLPIDEDCPQKPINPYGATKLFFEHALEAYSVSHGLRFVALRYFNAAGADASGKIGECHDPETHLIPLALRAAAPGGQPLTIFGRDFATPDGTCIRDFVHVSDLAAAHVKALAYLAGGGESVCLNLGTGKGASILDVLAAIERVTGNKVRHTFAAPRAGDPPALYANPAKAMSILQWRPAFDLDAVIATAWAWEQQRQIRERSQS